MKYYSSVRIALWVSLGLFAWCYTWVLSCPQAWMFERLILDWWRCVWKLWGLVTEAAHCVQVFGACLACFLVHGDINALCHAFPIRVCCSWNSPELWAHDFPLKLVWLGVLSEAQEKWLIHLVAKCCWSGGESYKWPVGKFQVLLALSSANLLQTFILNIKTLQSVELGDHTWKKKKHALKSERPINLLSSW